jgi:hypothetical protein
MAVQRGWDSVLTPIYDMVNHVNDPEKLNADNNSVYSAEGLRVWASKTIEVGEELLLSYDKCVDCFNDRHELALRDFGFVEPHPRKFNFAGEEQILVAVDEDEHDGETITSVDWLGNGESPSHAQIAWMKEECQQLMDFQHDSVLEERRDLMPEKEWNIIFQCHKALAAALDSAIENAIYDPNVVKDEDESGCDKDGNCSVPWLMFADLNKGIESGNACYRHIYQCETFAHGIDDYKAVGRSVSHYQSIDYCHDPKTKEMCFHIDGIFQQCASYRPHEVDRKRMVAVHCHEMGVHLPACYLPQDVKRVMLVCGGNAMSLHEILKYNSLELAVGLELDQEVMRGAFRHFDAQPHRDNEMVQWWFGSHIGTMKRSSGGLPIEKLSDASRGLLWIF